MYWKYLQCFFKVHSLVVFRLMLLANLNTLAADSAQISDLALYEPQQAQIAKSRGSTALVLRLCYVTDNVTQMPLHQSRGRAATQRTKARAACSVCVGFVPFGKKCVTRGAASANSHFVFRISHLPFGIFISSFHHFLFMFWALARIKHVAGDPPGCAPSADAAAGRPKMVANCLFRVCSVANCDLWRNRRVAIADRKQAEQQQQQHRNTRLAYLINKTCAYH